MFNKKKVKAAFFIFLIPLSFMACGSDKEDAAGANGKLEKASDVEVSTLRPQNFEEFIDVTGTVNADLKTVVSAEEQGVIQRFLKEKGAWVHRGETVVILKSKVLQASYNEAKSTYLLSKVTYERQANLYKDNVIPEQKYLDYKYSYERDKARFDMLAAKLEKMKINSPFSGFIDDKLVEVGEFILPGKPLFRIVKTDYVKIAAGVPENYILDVRKGTQAQITFDVLPEETLSGKITFVGPSINKSTRTFPIEIRLKNPGGELKPQMFANIKINKSNIQNVVVIPRDAIIETENSKIVFTVNGETAQKHQIEIGGAYNDKIWIKKGLSPGMQLIIVGHRDLVDGERITIHH